MVYAFLLDEMTAPGAVHVAPREEHLVDDDIEPRYADIMRTVVDLRDDLVARAKKLTGLKSKVDVVNEALRVLVEQEEAYRGLRRLRGRLRFVGTGADSLRERHGAHR